MPGLERTQPIRIDRWCLVVGLVEEDAYAIDVSGDFGSDVHLGMQLVKQFRFGFPLQTLASAPDDHDCREDTCDEDRNIGAIGNLEDRNAQEETVPGEEYEKSGQNHEEGVESPNDGGYQRS